MGKGNGEMVGRGLYERYCCLTEGHSIHIGTASTLYFSEGNSNTSSNYCYLTTTLLLSDTPCNLWCFLEAGAGVFNVVDKKLTTYVLSSFQTWLTKAHGSTYSDTTSVAT